MEVSFEQKVIQNLTSKIAGLEQANSMLFVENIDLKAKVKMLESEKQDGKHLHQDK